jgi:signal transduction histidine kinase
MNRRIWPAVLSLLALILFGSYLAYTQFLAEQIRRAAGMQAQVHTIVQRGIVSPDDNAALQALVDLQRRLSDVPVPVVVMNQFGQVVTAANIPGMEDTPGSRARDAAGSLTVYGDSVARAWAVRQNARYPLSRRAIPGGGEFTFGEPPMMQRLRWVPWLQAAAALMLILLIVFILRADMRAEREQLYAAMARELAHQMGTPLSSLGGWVEVLQLPEEERRQMTTTARIGDVMRADVDRLERVSRRFELIGKPQVLELVAMSDVVREIEEYFAPRLPALGAGIHMRTRVQPNMPPIRANRVLLVWAIENVVKNAIDALAGRGGRILLLADCDGHGEVHVHVADNGPGIDAKVRDRIFDAGVSTKSAGWGVGLSLSRRIVEDLHHGRITARSRRQSGTVFDIVVPTADASPGYKA